VVEDVIVDTAPVEVAAVETQVEVAPAATETSETKEG
jgi:hypothetical protein